MASEVLRLENILKVFPGVVALKNMSIQINAGEVHAVCGENGAGKSTLMKVITGIYQADGGDMYLYGDKVHFKNPKESFSKGISIIYQETSLFEEMSVLDNIFMGHEIVSRKLGIPCLNYGAMKEKLHAVFEMLHFNIPYNMKARDLGMAQKQMVEIAKSLVFDSKVLILDEPTASLTQREVDALFKIVRDLRDKGVAVVYISHRLEEIFELCDKVTVIRDGEFISTKDVARTNKEELVADMVGREMGAYYPKADVDIGEVILDVKNLCQFPLLKNINFNLKRGEILGFSGLAGAGRTELALALCGFTELHSGEIYVDNKLTKIKNYQQAKKNGIVYVSEDRGKYGAVIDMSIKENITMPLLEEVTKNGYLDLDKEELIAEKYRKDFEIKAPTTDFMVANLSGGNQQKVAVSKALACNPKILILDEPTRGVDVNAKAEIHGIVSNLAKDGLTIIMISSELPELLGMCDRIYVMNDGEIKGEFSREEASQEKILTVALNMNEEALND